MEVGVLCYVLGAAVQNSFARSPGSIHHRTSNHFQAFSYYDKLPLVLRLFVPIGVLFRNKELVEPGFRKT
jgi:hypothetical protein